MKLMLITTVKKMVMELDLIKTVFISLGGMLTVFLTYLLGREVTKAEIKNKNANTWKTLSEKNAQDITNLQKLVDIYHKRVEDVQIELDETKTGAKVLIRALEKRNNLLETQNKELKSENTFLKKQMKLKIQTSKTTKSK